MKTLITPILFLLTAVSYGQKEYAKIILDSLCSDRYDGRGYVNDGDNRSADFIIKELKNIGVKPFKKRGYEQHYFLNVNTFPYPLEVISDGDTLIPGVDYLVDPISGNAQGEFEVIEINSQNYASIYKNQVDLSTQKPAQKIFAFNFTTVKDKEKLERIRKMAYAGMDYFPIIWVEKNKLTYRVGRTQKNYPLIILSESQYNQPKKINLKIHSTYKPQYKSKNVIGYIPGKRKRKYIVFTAHYDHLGRMGTDTYFPGANDNASGTAMLLSLAKHYMQHRPKYSIVFCFFSGEEAGLEGSKYFVSNPYFKTKRIKFVLNIDIMGAADKGITLVNATEHPNDFDTFTRLNKEKNYLNKVAKRGPTANSDHYYFTTLGIPAFFIYSMGSVSNYHDIHDTAENTPLNKFDEVQSLLIDFVSSK
ncbi:M28 family metallopeptidase [Crocinitomix algicola]|uniref:M28 family metallopeptidase n=1 Tax=Crocinitomix algicola TaxID=1740263 RepID=UPI0008720376|nr:M20/M25/M40 family metallo-hydrolase [Crocinitomix algicola]